MNPTQIKPLIIGVGLVGKRHLEAQLSNVYTVGVFNKDTSSLSHYRKNKRIKIFKNLDEAIKWSTLVHICSPEDTHYDYIINAVKNRKAVLCEKPLTTNLKDALEIQKLVHSHKAVVIVGNNYRLTPGFKKIREKVLSGFLGKLTFIETTYLHDMTTYRLENTNRNKQDFLYVGGSHPIDLISFIANDKIEKVQASIGNKIRSEYDSEERYEIILKFSTGLLGHIRLDSSTRRFVNGTGLLVEGENGQMSSHNKIDKISAFTKGNNKLRQYKISNIKIRTIPIEIRIVNDFLAGLNDSFWPLPGINEAINTMKVIDAIQRAVKSGKTEETGI